MADPYFSEIKYLGGPTLDFIEVAVDAGTDVSSLVVTIYNSNGSIRSSNPLDGLTATTVAGKDIYVIDSSTATFTGLAKHNAIALSDDTGVYAFYSFDDNAATVTATEGPALGEGPSTEIGMAGAGESLETTDGGTTYVVQPNPSPGSIPCLTAGTMVSTDQG
ncbi:hypothetical protein [Aliiroseovarius sp. S253]|uniref:hypothetical protein n=1 Tax=Aliiroseovarius sp. S253 TaxID=3415133 RepID=UPI003C79FD89